MRTQQTSTETVCVAGIAPSTSAHARASPMRHMYETQYYQLTNTISAYRVSPNSPYTSAICRSLSAFERSACLDTRPDSSDYLSKSDAPEMRWAPGTAGGDLSLHRVHRNSNTLPEIAGPALARGGVYPIVILCLRNRGVGTSQAWRTTPSHAQRGRGCDFSLLLD